MPAPSNNKKRKITTVAVDKIDFDPAAREEYLTGFHKRKVARIKHAQEENAKREKEEKLRMRRELRQQRKVDLEKHVEEVNRLVRQANGEVENLNPDLAAESDSDDASSTASFTGFADPAPLNEQDEYVDEDKYTTVTIETVGISRSGMSRPGEDEAAEKARQDEARAKEAEAKKRVWTKERPKTDRPKKKKIKFRYETKAERKLERAKQGAKKKKQAAARKKE